MNYYNEFDLYAADWLRELIEAGLIPRGDVDTRSIKDVKATELRGYRQCHFFAGVAGWPLALRRAGIPDDEPLWTGSCPCQPYSSAGKGLGDDDPRNLWPDFFRLIRECRPVRVFGEQVSSAIGHGWLDGISADLEAEAYTCGAVVLGAHSVGGPHQRQRLYWLAESEGERHDGEPAAAESSGRRGLEGGGAVDWMADARSIESRRLSNDERDSISTARGCCENCILEHAQGDGRQQGRAEPDRRGSACGCRDCCMANANGALVRGQPHAGQQPIDEQDGGTGGMVFTESQREDTEPESSCEGLLQRSGSGVAGFWSEFDLIHCTDGKARRVEPGSFPLASGVPRKLGPLLTVLEGMGVDPKRAKRIVRNFRGRLAKAGRNRVGRLRGYGNALCVETATAFVIASYE